MNERAYQVISRMTDAEWPPLLLRLGRYALRVCRNLSWRTQNAQELPKGETAKSLVSKAFEKLFSGERNWDPEVAPSLENYVMDVIDSLANQLAESSDNTRLTVLPAEEHEMSKVDAQSVRSEASAEWLTRSGNTPEEILLRKEQDHEDDEALLALIDECDGEPVLKKVLEAMFDGCVNPRSVAERCGLTPAEVYNANKQLDRKIAAVKKRMAVGGTIPVPVTKGKKNV